jgi:hypothetical protein
MQSWLFWTEWPLLLFLFTGVIYILLGSAFVRSGKLVCIVVSSNIVIVTLLYILAVKTGKGSLMGFIWSMGQILIDLIFAAGASMIASYTKAQSTMLRNFVKGSLLSAALVLLISCPSCVGVGHYYGAFGDNPGF